MIILHYKNYKETIACVNSAIKQQGSGYEIVVVDNGSEDGSYEILKKEFGKTPHVTVKRLKKNLGFARGNNAGIRYARERLGAENCFICNSDVVFEATLFEELLAGVRKGIGLISPAVYDTGNKPQPLSVDTGHPYRIIAFTWLYVLYKSLTNRLWQYFIRFLQKKVFKLSDKQINGFHRLYTIRSRQKALMKKIKIRRKTAKSSEPKLSDKKQAHLYRIQGCAFLLTEEYFKHYYQLYPKTFLYGEELNLSVYLKKAGLRAILADTSPVIHKGKQSSDEFYQTDGEGKRLRLTGQSLLHSLPLLFFNDKTIRKLF